MEDHTGEEDGGRGRRVTRRQFLIGGAVGGAVAAGGLVVASKLPLRAMWIRATGGCGQEGPIPPASEATVRTGSFNSRFVLVPVGYAIALPPRTKSGTPMPVVICLPGRGGTARPRA